mmetsp:Transcript_54045/g.156047  ORF Transcript_54045/g.156047 Transcript_54045/m.156047 type:complete len:233 (+) Transcript_54045:1982-2680(+)
MVHRAGRGAMVDEPGLDREGAVRDHGLDVVGRHRRHAGDLEPGACLHRLLELVEPPLHVLSAKGGGVQVDPENAQDVPRRTPKGVGGVVAQPRGRRRIRRAGAPEQRGGPLVGERVPRRAGHRCCGRPTVRVLLHEAPRGALRVARGFGPSADAVAVDRGAGWSVERRARGPAVVEVLLEGAEGAADAAADELLRQARVLEVLDHPIGVLLQLQHRLALRALLALDGQDAAG